MSTINTKLLADVYAALTVAEGRFKNVDDPKYDLASFMLVYEARRDLKDAMRRLPPVVVSVIEPDPIPEFLAAAI